MAFDIEPEKNSCSYDALTIYDGLGDSKMLARLCGKELPKGVVTSSNKALVKFESDNSVDGRGFMLKFFSGTLTLNKLFFTFNNVYQ